MTAHPRAAATNDDRHLQMPPGHHTATPMPSWPVSYPADDDPLQLAAVANEVHALQVYEDDAVIVDAAARFVLPGLERGETAVVIGTGSHRDALAARLAAAGVDVDEVQRQGLYVALDARATLSQFMVDGIPDARRFGEVVGGVVANAAARAGHAPIRAFGEMVALLWEDGHHEAAIQVEGFWNDLAQRLPLALLCVYPLRDFAGPEHEGRFGRICQAHTHVIPAESYSALAPADDRFRVVAELQQRAAALEAEIAARQAAEAALRRQAHEMSEFFENAAIPIHWVGPDGIVLRANRAELELLGYAPEEYVGHHIAEFHVDRGSIDEIIARLAAGETVHSYEARVRRKNGTICHVAIDSNALWENGTFVHARCFTRDVTATKHAEEAQARLAAIVQSSDDAIVGKTPTGIVTSWNIGAERIFGYAPEEMIGQSISRLIPLERPDELPRLLAAVVRGQRVDHFETERIRKDGRRIHVSITLSPILDGAGRVVGVSKIARDVTDRKRADEERERLLGLAERAREEAEIASRAKDEFLSVVSHELRTPLAAILGWVSVLKTGAAGDRASRAIETIERSGRAQAKLIEDLLDVSRIIGGRMRLDLRLVDLAPIVQSAFDTIYPTADAKGVHLAAELDPAAGPVAGDADRLQQIVWNLLSNAVKFTPAGGRVELRLERRESDVQLTVTDTGRGIAPEFLPFVFERFRQADTAESRRTGGLGLGLAIVRHLVELHGGEAAVASEGEGRGASFRVILPLTPLAADDGYAAAAPRPALAGRHVLVVDDEADARESLGALLRAHGARVILAGSVAEARAALHAEVPDVVVSDICLPGEDGYAFIRELSSTERLRRVPAIAVTGFGASSDGQALAAGYRVRLRKPVDPSLLLAAVSQLTARPKRR